MQKANPKDSELSKDADTQVLLSKFLSGEIKTLEPVYDQQTGYHYPQEEAIVGDESSGTPSALVKNVLNSSTMVNRNTKSAT